MKLLQIQGQPRPKQGAAAEQQYMLLPSSCLPKTVCSPGTQCSLLVMEGLKIAATSPSQTSHSKLAGLYGIKSGVSDIKIQHFRAHNNSKPPETGGQNLGPLEADAHL